MATVIEQPVAATSSSDLEFFGVKIKCKSPRLAALLNSDVTESVVVVGKRAMDLFSVPITEQEIDEALTDLNV
jgi:hypothetical protein